MLETAPIPAPAAAATDAVTTFYQGQVLGVVKPLCDIYQCGRNFCTFCILKLALGAISGNVRLKNKALCAQ